MIELLEVGWCCARICMRQGLEPLCAIAPRRAGNRMNCFELLVQRQREEGMRLRPQFIHCGNGDAVRSDGEESDLTASRVNLPCNGLSCGKPAAACCRKIDDRDLLHALLTSGPTAQW